MTSKALRLFGCSVLVAHVFASYACALVVMLHALMDGRADARLTELAQVMLAPIFVPLTILIESAVALFTGDPTPGLTVGSSAYLAALVLLSTVVLECFAHADRRDVRTLNGHCPACGYDLRATPDRCPECGAHP